MSRTRTHRPVPRWIGTGVPTLDTATGRTGVIQMFRDDAGMIHTTARRGSTEAALRPLGASGPTWWAQLADLKRPEAAR
jgi:hypothetical protein